LILLASVFPGLKMLGSHAWILRLVASLVLLAAAVVCLAVLGIGPRHAVIRGGKLASPQRIRERALVEKISRAFFLLCAFGLTWHLLFPVTRGTIAFISGRRLDIVDGEVVDRSTYMGTWFLSQGIRIKGRSEAIQYFFSVERPVRVGVRHRAMVLPNTNFALDVSPREEVHAREDK
jgi:hypothetical protein